MKQLSIVKQMWVYLMLTVIYLASLLFIPAGSFLYWRGWVMVAEFIGSSIAISLFFVNRNPEFLKKRFQAGPLAEKERSQQIIQTGSALAFISLLVSAGLDYRFHWSSVPIALTLIASVILLFGFYIVYLSFKTNHFASSIIEKQKKQHVVQDGIYTIIRHPMYAGASLVIGAMPWVLGSTVAWIGVVVMGICLIGRIIHEERYLKQNLQGYAAYCKRVPYRLIPYIW